MDPGGLCSSSSSSSGLLLQHRVVTAEELAGDTRRFAAFQWAIGVGEAQQILSRPEEETAAAATTTTTGDTEQQPPHSQQQEKPTIKFRGWEPVREERNDIHKRQTERETETYRERER